MQGVQLPRPAFDGIMTRRKWKQIVVGTRSGGRVGVTAPGG